MPYQIDHVQKLQEQLKFLRNSCNLFDQGSREEAIRIAVCIRVLLHNTKNSTSLLKHLNAENINLISTISEYDDKLAYFHGTGQAIENADGSRTLIPSFHNVPCKNLVSVKKWWNQAVFVAQNGTILSRKDAILSAANQDGGAHVDEYVNQEYSLFASDGAGGTHVYRSSDGIIEQPSKGLHLVSIRQFGFELEQSTELINLLGSP